MAGFSEKLSAMKGKQEAADLKKKEEAEQAVETARLEREGKRNELSTEHERVSAEFSQAEQTANEAREVIAEVDAFASEQGENLDPEAKVEIDAMKVEADEAQQKFEELKTRLDALNAEISAFEGSEQETASTEATEETTPQENATTENIEQPTEQSTGDSVAVEKTTEANPEVATKKVDRVKQSLETAEGSFQELEQDLEQAGNAIQTVEGMGAGSRAKYDAAFEMRRKVEEIFFNDATIDAVLRYTDTSNSPDGKQKIEAAKKRLEELKQEYQKTLNNMMVVWWNAKGQYEGGKSAEIAKNIQEI